MSRRKRKIQKRVISQDAIYNNLLVSRFTNRLMRDGKKTVAQKVMHQCLKLIAEKTSEDPVKIFEAALQNVGPRMEVRPRRVGGASYQVPQEVRGDRRVALAIRWLIQSAKKLSSREFHTFSQKLAQEFMAAARGEGEAIKKRDMVLRMAEANRAFAHFRW